MRHLILCRELPPGSGGGIGTYVARSSALLAECGETVHVVTQMGKGSVEPLERRVGGRLVIHRVPCQRPGLTVTPRPHRRLRDPTARALFASGYHPQAFAWTAGKLAERLVEEEGIDVIEAQEYEAPLYFFQLRRALGLGPTRKPPCIIHVHSPTELIAFHNDWDLGHPYFLTAKRLEDFSLGSADALVCPSHRLAADIAARPDLDCEQVHVIHYPTPEWISAEDEPGPTATGPIVYVGRLERRKGSIEWLSAAVAAARERQDLRFDFVGGAALDTDWRAGEDVFAEQVPAEVRGRFRWLGQKRADEVRAVLRGARFVVVPSRWDNFPNSCVEAMSLGLPVLTTPSGGMGQLVEDGHTGWLADGSSADDLHRVLLRAARTPGAELESMGRRAREVVGERCDPARITSAHLEMRRELVARGAQRSLATPPVLRTRALHASGAASPREEHGIGVVIVRPVLGPEPVAVRALADQTVAPLATVTVRYGPPAPPVPPSRTPARGAGDPAGDADLVYPDRAGAIRAGLALMSRRDPPPEGVAVLDEQDLPATTYIERCRDVLGHDPEVGLVSFWEGPAEALSPRPCPSRPYQWAWNDAAAASVLRLAALDRVGALPASEDPLYERWYLANNVLASGLAGVTVPEVLATRSRAGEGVGRLDSGRMMRSLLEPFRAEVAEDAPALLLLTRSGSAGILRDPGLRPREFAELALKLSKEWRRALWWAWRRALRRIRE